MSLRVVHGSGRVVWTATTDDPTPRRVARADAADAIRVDPALLGPDIAAATRAGEARGAAAVRLFAIALSRLGAGAATDGRALRRALPPDVTPPRLKDDCFAMPQGVRWIAVGTALDRLRADLACVATRQVVPLGDAAGRIVARDVAARRANPPRANAAVDGFGFAAAAATGAGVTRLPLAAGRAAAGRPFDGAVPQGYALRILTGAILPEGIDTVVLEEDCAVDRAAVTFDGPVKPRANTRPAGEDVKAGATILASGRRLMPGQLALLAAAGHATVEVFRPLKVGVLSTGDEIVPAGAEALPHETFDANRPMLLAMLAGWGCTAVDLGHVRDRRDLVRRRLDAAANRVDAVLTSGGASSGEEDHVSRLLAEEGRLRSWRIAMKPGRPLALAMWRGVPVFGLPGNPVAAFVTAAIFARPALSLMAGGGWREPLALSAPAAFAKRKKAGRREYLRARLRNGRVEVFASEGSGRVSGLSWAEGLVELPDEAMEVAPGDAVRYLPFPDLLGG